MHYRVQAVLQSCHLFVTQGLYSRFSHVKEGVFCGASRSLPMFFMQQKNRAFDRIGVCMRHVVTLTCIALVLSGLAACSPRGQVPNTATSAKGVTGAGASFPAPLYAKWAARYAQLAQAQVNYQSIGSGAGIKQLEVRTISFAASDEPLPDELLKARGWAQFPTVIGGVVPVVNIQGIQPGELVLDGVTLAQIYLGAITRWNDSAIQALNPTLALPDAAITPIRRADSSGTSFNFTNYLSKVSAEWKEQVGEGKTVNWPAGIGGKGNEGVAAFVVRLPYSIGYVEYSYVKQNKMAYVLMKNVAGNIVAPQENSFKEAAAAADWARSFHQVLTHQPAANAWPITAATYIVLPTSSAKPQANATILGFFDWAYGQEGDAIALKLDYVPLPENVKTIVRQSWASIQHTAGASAANQ